MKFFFRAFIALLVIMAMSISFIGCGTKSDSGSTVTSQQQTTAEETKKEPVTLSYAMFASWIDWGGTKDLIEKYQQETGNTIEVQAIDDNQYSQVLMAKIASGDLWDVFAAYSGTAGTKYNAEKNCVDLSNEPWASRVADGALPFLTTNGKVYCAPTAGSNAIGMIYNKKVFEDLNLQVPQTLPEFEAVCDTLKSKGITPIYMALKDGWPVSQVLNGEWANLWGHSPELLDKLNANQIKWSEVPEFVSMLTRLDNYVKKGYFNKDMATATYEMSQKAIAEGTAAMSYMGDWVTTEILKKYPDAKIGMFADPTEKGDNYIAATGPFGIYISANGKNIDASKEFVGFMCSQDSLKYYYSKKPDMPVWKDIKVEELNPCAADVLQMVQDGKSRGHYGQLYVIPYAGDMESIMQELMLGVKTPEQTAKAWDDFMLKTGKQMQFPGF